MIQWLVIDLTVLVCGIVLTGIIIPQILLIAFRRNLFDTPDPRKIHQTEIPRLGGIAFFPSILLAFFLLYGFGIMSGDQQFITQFLSALQSMCFIAAGAVLLYLIGMADDLVGVRYRAKFIVQAIAAALVMVGGIQMNNLQGLFGVTNMSEAIVIPFTLIVILFIINSINLIDGIDGLASGLSAIACAFYAYVFVNSGLYLFSALAVATLGTLIPFFVYNVFGNPLKRRKIFMGDTGALTIGLMLSVMSIRICQIETFPKNYNSGVIAFAPLLIPCLDVVRVYFHRIKARRNPFLPDKTHIHHKLLALGLGQRLAMITIIGSSALLTLINYYLSRYVEITILLLCDLLLWVVVNAILTYSIRKRERCTGTKLYE